MQIEPSANKLYLENSDRRAALPPAVIVRMANSKFSCEGVDEPLDVP
jgi:hypothetical protein